MQRHNDKQQQCNNAPTTTTNAICMWYHFTRLNDKAFQGISPQQFEWLKHSQGMSPQQLNDKAYQGMSPQQLNDEHSRA